MHMYGMMGSDPAKIAGAKLGEGVVRRVLREFARPFKWMLIGFLAVIVFEAVLDLGPPLFFRQIIDQAIPDKDVAQLNKLALLVVFVAVASAGASFIERFFSSKIGEGLIFDLRRRLFDHVQRLPVSFFTRTQTGALISRLNSDVLGAQRALTATLGSVVSNVIVLGTTLVAMFLLDWRLTLIALVLLPLFIVPAKRVGRRMQKLTRDGMNVDAEMNARMTERFNVSGAMLVKLFGNHNRERDEFADRAGQVRDIGVKTAMYGRTFFIALGLVGALGTAAVYWLGGISVINGVITVGTLVAMAAFVTRIYQPLTALTNARVDIMTAFVSFDRVFEVLDAPNPIEDRPGAIDLVDPVGRVELDQVWFRYPASSDAFIASLENPAAAANLAVADAEGDGEDADETERETDLRTLESLDPVDALHALDELAAPDPSDPDAQGPAGAIVGDGAPYVLQAFDAVVEPGQLVAIVGPSGAGKSTLASLVPRLYDVSGGAVRIDGHDVRDLTQTSLRAAIGVVSQDSHLFHDSVLDNLRYAKPEATMDEVIGACRAAQIHDVIAALPEGYDTVVGERGYRLSGGEKQRIAIARMLLKDPAVVILDEATSHLDAENEALVQAALTTALEGRTSIVIAHRLSTIVSADQILVIDGGQLVDRGRHAELLARGGLYAELYTTLVQGGTAGSRRPAAPPDEARAEDANLVP
jgi:ATP-binding cassette subfamily B protein